MKERAEHCLQCIQQFFIIYVCLPGKPIDNMLRYVNGDKQYQFHDLTVDVEPGHVYSKTGQLRFRTWTNKGKIIRLDSFITTTVITIRERYRLLSQCSVIQGTMKNERHYYTIHRKVARYSFSGSIPPKFEHKLRRQKQSFGKIATTVVLDKDENLFWSGLQRHQSCHSNEMMLLPILLAVGYLGTGNCSSKIIHGSFFFQ